MANSGKCESTTDHCTTNLLHQQTVWRGCNSKLACPRVSGLLSVSCNTKQDQHHLSNKTAPSRRPSGRMLSLCQRVQLVEYKIWFVAKHSVSSVDGVTFFITIKIIELGTMYRWQPAYNVSIIIFLICGRQINFSVVTLYGPVFRLFMYSYLPLHVFFL